MDLPAFVQLVKDMRRLQSAYFKGPNKGKPSALAEAKDAEGRVDRAIKELTADGAGGKQPSLFDEHDGTNG
jgi:hypothetical protein